MITIKDLLEPKEETSFTHDLAWLNNKKKIVVTRTSQLPMLKAPTSAVMFWINRCKLFDRKDIQSFDEEGYQNLKELRAEINGLYVFYQQIRYVL